MRALISVYDKEGLAPFAQGLMELGVEIVATPGTQKYLQNANIPAVDISNMIGMPAILSARLKTLHPKIHGGILADRDKLEHVTQMRNLGLLPIDIVVVNMNASFQPNSFEELVENIDTGGPALIRSAASNYKHILAVTNPEQYPLVLKYLKNKSEDENFRANLATVAFSATARYDALIASYMASKLHTKEMFPSILPGHYIREAYLNCGENEHQKAAFYRNLMSPVNIFGMMKQIAGAGIKGSNLLDIDIGWEMVSLFKKPCATIVCHHGPVGIAVREKIGRAFQDAYQYDKRSAYGGFIAANRVIDEETAQLIGQNENYFQGIAALGYEEKAFEILTEHPVWGNEIKLLELPAAQSRVPQPTLRSFVGGLLLQEADEIEGEPSAWRIVTRAKPDEKQLVDLAFALAVASVARSSSAVASRHNATIAISSGQMSALEAVAIAISKAGERSRGAVLAMGEPCLFVDAIKLAYEAGIAAIIQPRDNSRITSDIVGTANELGVPMVFCKNSHCRY
jgi:phosphoribosylaminoimidazolecarboxamide formyltransferase/IMP cyclohydrolase